MPDALSAVEIASAVRSRTLRAVDVVAQALHRIEQADPALSAFIEVWPEEALRQAAEVDARVGGGSCSSGVESLGEGERLPLAGVPIAVKGRRGLRTAGPLLAAGCVAVGATSVPGPGTVWQTWGLGRYGRTVNPWRHDRTPGGSSAGSAVAVAAGLVPLATGNDGAGSVRIPAAWCGIVGLKVGNGRLPSSDPTGLMVPGVLTRCVGDAAAYWRVMSGAVTGDGTQTADMARGSGSDSGSGSGSGSDMARGSSSGSAKEHSLAVPYDAPTAVWSPDLGFDSPDPDVVAVAHAVAVRLTEAGVLRPARPRTALRLHDPAPAWLALRTPGAGPTPEVHRIRAANDRRLADLFADAQLLMTPTAPIPPHGHEGPGERYSTALTWAFNLSGHPAISIPAGFGPDGCPVGLQLVAAHGGESLLLSVAGAAEGHIGAW
ncbi:amidase [Streptomyces sp. uw30]|uniref:amidase n=1 Tax=Streptomyces sp. uw30 TaxID=1828179 RepID=UPI0011CECFB3|nr:amidase [Streptomyces sp. uw30]TXS50555.1 amidase [Streptomyces sp. uw30]